jgi:glycosyltransferase involved in cell wall biosynthesis
MLGMIVPAHNEEALIGACLDALCAAAEHPALYGEEVVVVVVLDACDDATLAVVKRHADVNAARATIICTEVAARNVGVARAAGARLALQRGARWLAFTDADTRVSPGWLAAQIKLDVDVVCGSVAVDDWSPHREHADMLREHFARTYNDRDGHRHIHGANLGVAAAAYQRAGGFRPLPCHEDVALVAALADAGARFAWSAAPRVTTSARTDARCREGFGETMRAVAAGGAN